MPKYSSHSLRPVIRWSQRRALNVYSYTGSGGIVFGGAAIIGNVYSYTGSGGIAFGGSATVLTGRILPELYPNLASTTVAAGGYILGSGVLNVASTALPFKQTATYRLAVSDPVTTDVKVLLRVTGINSSTQFAVQSEGTDHSANFGDIVEAVLTEGAIYQTRSDMSQIGNMTGLPSPSNASGGDQFYAYDGYELHFDGTNWIPIGMSLKLGVPVAGNYTAVNLASATLTAASNGLYLRDSATEEGLHIYVMSVPSTPYTLTVRMYGYMQVVSAKMPYFGICFRASGSGGVEALYIANNSGGSISFGDWIGVDYWTNATTFNSSIAGPTQFGTIGDIWLQIKDDGSNKIFNFSVDGINWEQVLSETRTTNITANQIGFFIRTNNASQIVAATLNSWLVS